jgi:hypothetical protein
MSPGYKENEEGSAGYSAGCMGVQRKGCYGWCCGCRIVVERSSLVDERRRFWERSKGLKVRLKVSGNAFIVTNRVSSVS